MLKKMTGQLDVAHLFSHLDNLCLDQGEKHSLKSFDIITASFTKFNYGMKIASSESLNLL